MVENADIPGRQERGEPLQKTFFIPELTMPLEKIRCVCASPRFRGYLLFAIVLLGIYLRMYGLNKPGGLWFDEAYCYYEAKASFPFGIMQKLYAEDIHAPLYYFILHFWMKCFGDQDVILRVLSVIFGIATIPVLHLAGKELDADKTGLLAALLASISSVLIYYSQEVKFYSFLTLLGALSALFLTRIRKRSSRADFAALSLVNLLIM